MITRKKSIRPHRCPVVWRTPAIRCNLQGSGGYCLAKPSDGDIMVKNGVMPDICRVEKEEK
ncbi:MAG: hypothetical protein HQL90_04200 [Magnetococcales bacterium]|nr:hypothetical protein [Magnetococcales bacterium]